jgi:hypothetical protein
MTQSTTGENSALPSLPQLQRVHQTLYDRVLIDLDSVVIRDVERRLKDKVTPGQRIAIGVGSRGVANIARIARATAEAVRRVDGDPFIIPAMGSHGGGTAQGQIEILESLGVTEAFCRCPILATMDVVEIGATDDGMPVYLDRHAAAADGIIVINRVKKHTDFHGTLESGLMKMICIGLGKKAQADLVHSYGAPGLKKYVPLVARVTLASARILLGVATLENGYEETSEIVIFGPEEIEAGEQRLLRRHKRQYPMLPFDEADILIVDRIGKDVSGTGMDTNVIGRMRIHGEKEPTRPRIRSVVALSLTEASHGNAVGVGLADLISQRLRDEIDDEAMSVNVITSGFLERGKIPITRPNDRDAIATALSRLPPAARQRPKVARILDTLHVGDFDVSEALLEDVLKSPNMSLVGAQQSLTFDRTGRIAPMALNRHAGAVQPVSSERSLSSVH